MCVPGDRWALVKIFTRSCVPILCGNKEQWSLLCQCLQGAPIPAPVSADAALLHFLLALGLFIPLLIQAFSNTQMTSKILLPQVGEIPICVGFADSAGPRGCCPILMNSLQAWMVLLTNIMYSTNISSAQPPAGLALSLGEVGWIDTASFLWGLLSAESFRASNYHFSSRKLLFF